jgi:hypothetical protein
MDLVKTILAGIIALVIAFLGIKVLGWILSTLFAVTLKLFFFVAMGVIAVPAYLFIRNKLLR